MPYGITPFKKNIYACQPEIKKLLSCHMLQADKLDELAKS